MKTLSQAGDTIVEVLIAIAVTSMVLTGAFVSTRQSTLGTRKSQERVEALKVAEEQLERLRELTAVPGNQFTNSGQPSYTCVTTSSTWQAVATGFQSPENFNEPTYHPPACTRTPATGVPYYPTIVRSGPAGNYTFKIHVRWDRLGGGMDEVTLAYRSNS